MSEIKETAERAVNLLFEVEKLAEPFNDYGSVMGIQDELDSIYKDLKETLYSSCTRSRRLIKRIELWNEGNLNGDKL